MPQRDDHTERVARAVEEAQRPKPARATREDFLAYTARRFGLSPELAARIDGTTATRITVQARRLAAERATLHAAEAEAQADPAAAPRRALVAGHHVDRLDDADDGFNPADVISKARGQC